VESAARPIVKTKTSTADAVSMLTSVRIIKGEVTQVLSGKNSMLSGRYYASNGWEHDLLSTTRKFLMALNEKTSNVLSNLVFRMLSTFSRFAYVLVY
jgi:hypothetical protein